MTVKELIALLSECAPEKPVYAYSRGDNQYGEVEGIGLDSDGLQDIIILECE